MVILRKIIVITLGPSFMDRLFYFTSDECLYGNISIKFEFAHSKAKVTVKAASFIIKKFIFSSAFI